MKKILIAISAIFFAMSNPVLAMDKPVILINAFIVPEGKEAEAIAFWERAADFMRKQPGYISTTLHQAILPDAKFKLINVAKWRSAEDFKKARQALITQGGIKPVEGLIANPSLYKVLRSD